MRQLIMTIRVAILPLIVIGSLVGESTKFKRFFTNQVLKLAFFICGSSSKGEKGFEKDSRNITTIVVKTVSLEYRKKKFEDVTAFKE